MAGSIEGAVGASLALQNWNMVQEKDNVLLKKVLDGQKDHITSLVDSAISGIQELSPGSMIGSRLHVTA